MKESKSITLAIAGLLVGAILGLVGLILGAVVFNTSEPSLGGDVYTAKSTKKFLYLQQVNDAYPWGQNPTYLLMEEPSPSDLDKDSDLDYTEVDGLSNSSEEVLLEKTFTYAPIKKIGTMENSVQTLRGTARAVAMASIALDSCSTGVIYWTKAVFDLGEISPTGDFVSLKTATSTPNFSVTNSTSYSSASAQAFLSDVNYTIGVNNRLALRVKLYGYVNSGDSCTGKIKLHHARGSADSYLEVYFEE